MIVGMTGAAAAASDFRSTGDGATVLYDAPSAKSKPLFVLSRDTPLEVIVPVEGWTKVRDAGGTIGWVERKSLTDRRSLVVRVQLADVRANPDDAAPLVFRAEQHVLLELAEAANGPTTTVTPGSNVITPRSAKDLKPLRVRDLRYIRGVCGLSWFEGGGRAPLGSAGRAVTGAFPPRKRRVRV
jgi:hypothetical protein